MGITYIGHGPIAAAPESANRTTLLPALRDNSQVNDIVLLAIFIRSLNNQVSVKGWTELATWNGPSSQYWIFARRLTGDSDDQPVVNRTNTNGDFYAHASTYRGCTTYRNAWEVISASATGTANPIILPGITTLSDNAMIIAFILGYDNIYANNLLTATSTSPASYSKSYLETSLGIGCVSVKAYALKTYKGSTGDLSLNFDNTINGGWGGIIISLAEEGIRFHKIYGNRGAIGGGSSVISTYSAGLVIKVISEAMSLADSFKRTISFRRIVQEIFSLGEIFVRSRTMKRISTETESIQDVINRAKSLIQELVEETTLNEDVGYVPVYSKFANETIHIIENIHTKLQIWMTASRSALFGDPFFGDPMFADTGQGFGAQRYAYADENISIGERPYKFNTRIKFINEVLELTDSLIRTSILLLLKVITNTIEISSTIYRIGNKIINETIQIVDGLLRFTERLRFANEVVNIVESKMRKFALLRIMSEAVSIALNLYFISWQYAFANELLQIDEYLKTRRSLVRRMKDWIWITGESLRAKTGKFFINETIQIIESIKNFGLLRRIQSESIQIADYLRLVFIYFLNETMHIDEAKNWLRHKVHILSAVLGVNESLALFRTLRRFRNESVTLLETNSIARLMNNIVSEAISIGDSFINIAYKLVHYVDSSLQISEMIAYTWILISYEALWIYESLSWVRTLRRRINEQIGTVDDYLKERIRRIAETLSFSDALHFVQGVPRYVSETVHISDSMKRSVGRLIYETVQIVENIYASKILRRFILEIIQIADLRRLVRSRSISTIIQLIDSVGYRNALKRYIDEIEEIAANIGIIRIRLIAETESIIESIIHNTVLRRVFTEFMYIYDSFMKGRIRWIGEAVSIYEDSIFAKTLYHIVNEIVEFSSEILRIVVITITETETIIENTIRSRIIRRFLQESEIMYEQIKLHVLKVRKVLEDRVIVDLVGYMRSFGQLVSMEYIEIREGGEWVRIFVKIAAESIYISESIAYRLWVYIPKLFARIRTLYKG